MKKSFTKIISVLLVLILAVSVIPMSAFNASAATSGTCGDNLTWSYDISTCTLTISGTGEMYFSGSKPWQSFVGEIVSVIIDEGVASISSNAFSLCDNLVNVSIPNSVTSIGNRSFYYSQSLEHITVDADNQYYSNDGYGVLFNKDKTTLLQYPIGHTRTNYTIPDSVTKIGMEAFYKSNNLTSITIPDRITKIGSYAFYDCNNLTSVTIPDSVTSIGVCGFADCDNLAYVTIGKNVETIGVMAFSGCNIVNFNVDEDNQWYYTDYYGVLFNKSKTILIKYPSGDERKSYSVPDGVITIEESAFADSNNLLSVAIPNGVNEIDEGTFSNCGNLESVIIPETVNFVKFLAFGNCQNLKDVYYFGTEEQWNKISVGSSNDDLLNATIHHNYCPKNGNNQHFYTLEITTPATHLTTGVMTYTCDCGDSYTETIDKIAEHDHKAVVTNPTCTEKGYTTYTCECGDSYVDNYVAESGHSHTSEITTPATHLSVGVKTFTCSCGDTYTEVIDKIATHNHIAIITEPTCTEQGYTTYTCECGDTYISDYVDATGHSEGDNEGNCSACGEHICDHDCHKSGIAGFFWKIVCLFNKLFGSNKFCECGAAHY